MKVILNETEIEAINKALKKESIDYNSNNYQYFDISLNISSLNSFFDEIQISVLVEVDSGIDVEYCQLVNTEQGDSMDIENYCELELFEGANIIKLLYY